MSNNTCQLDCQDQKCKGRHFKADCVLSTAWMVCLCSRRSTVYSLHPSLPLPSDCVVCAMTTLRDDQVRFSDCMPVVMVAWGFFLSWTRQIQSYQHFFELWWDAMATAKFTLPYLIGPPNPQILCQNLIVRDSTRIHCNWCVRATFEDVPNSKSTVYQERRNLAQNWQWYFKR